MQDFLQVTASIPSQNEAARIATALVEQRLAACVQMLGPVHSTYRWQGAVERAEEWLCVIKTTRASYPAIEAAVRALHSYECPEIIATPITHGSEAYLSWLADQMRPPSPDGAKGGDDSAGALHIDDQP